MKKVAQRIWACALAFLIALSSTGVTVWAEGAPSSEPAVVDDVYQIGTAAELTWFANQVNGGNTGINAVLTQSIDLNSQAWTPIGNDYDHEYSGTFDGQNETISNLSINATTGYQGLFGNVGKTGTVKNLTVGGTVSVKANGNYVAGLVGFNKGTIDNCTTNVNVTRDSTSTSAYTGGITGQNNGTIIRCYNGGAVKGVIAGGIAGYQSEATSSISGCYNAGAISCPQGNLASGTGGIVGKTNKTGYVYNCINAGVIESESTLAANSYVGGIVGRTTKNTATPTAAFFNNLNCGELKSAGSVTAPIAGSLLDGNFAAGNVFLADATDEATGAYAEEQLKSSAVVDKLNRNEGSSFVPTIDESIQYVAVANGYPTLKWLAGSAPVVPVPVTAVSLAGSPKAGEKLTAKATGMDGTAATKVTYQWQSSSDNGGSFTDIAGATDPTFTIPEDGSYLGALLRVQVSGEEGSSATSQAIGPVEKSDAQKLAEDKEALTLNVTGAIKEAQTLVLPTAGGNGSAITWQSDTPSVITDAGVVKIPDSGIANVKLTAHLTLGGVSDSKVFSLTVYSEAGVGDQEYVDAAKKALEDSWTKLNPVYGKDTNIVTVLSNRLAELGYENVQVSILTTGNADYIAADGSITYYAKNPNETDYLHFANVSLTFQLQRGGASCEYSKTATIHWDADFVRATMTSEIADKVTEESIRGSNESLAAVTSDLTLPKVVDDKKWALIEWRSSDPSVISIDASGQSSADTLFDPYKGVIKRGMADQVVTLTATFDYQFVRDGDEAPITLTKQFDVRVKALDGTELQDLMQRELDENYTLDKLTYMGGGALSPDAVDWDIQLLTPSKTGIAGVENYQFEVTSSDPDLISVNSYRANVYRPLPGQADQTVVLTVKMSHKNYNLSVTKTLSLTVKALEQGEIDSALALMESAKQNYFDGLNKGVNTDANHISGNLSSFQEAVWNGDTQSVDWIYNYRETTGKGIVPVSIDPERPSELWDRFYSSNPSVISHENLLVTQPEYNQKVTISSCLTSEVFERYALKYPEREDFAKLYRQPVSVELTVLGAKGEGTAEQTKVKGTFALIGDSAHGSDPHIAYPTWFKDSFEAEAGTTVMDVFQKLLTERGYSYEGSHYISSITTPGGLTLAEKANGPDSGWMFSVNGEVSPVYADSYILKDGDTVLWFYTDDYDGDSRVENGEIAVDSDVTLPDYIAQWGSFRGSDANVAVVQSKTPTAANAKLSWSTALKEVSDWNTAMSEPLIINNQLYIAVGDELVVLERNGTVVKKGQLAEPIEYTCRPIYEGGKVIVPLRSGRFQALAADSLKTVWLTDALPARKIDGKYYDQQILGTVVSDGGLLYAATACTDSKGSYGGLVFCFEAATGQLVWQFENPTAGYYWSGAVVVDGTLIIAGDDGILLALDAKTGGEVDRLDLGSPVRSTIVRAEHTVYITSQDGMLHKVELQANGASKRSLLRKSAVRQGDLFGTHERVSFADYSTGTPAIYSGKAYIGGKLSDGTGLLSVIDLNTMQVLQRVSVPGEVKSTPLVSVDPSGKVSVYFTSNDSTGGLYALHEGQSRADVIFLPEGDAANYCISSAIVDKDGTLYYTNDSGQLFAISSAGGNTPDPDQPGDDPNDEPSDVPAAGGDNTPSNGEGAANTGDSAGLNALLLLLFTSAGAFIWIIYKKHPNEEN